MNVRIVVTWQDDFMGKLARRWGIATWTHTAIKYRKYWGPGTEWRVIESSSHGVVERSWNEFIDGVTEGALYRTKRPLNDTGDIIVAFAWGNVGKPYNFWWLVKVALQLLRRRFHVGALMYPAHICSSLVYTAFLYAGIDLVPGRADVLVTPDELANSSLLEKVWSL